MSTNSFVVEDYYDLLNLHKALMEAKFCDEPNNTYVSASSIIARLHNELLDVRINAEVEKYGSEAKESWDRWRKIDKNRREWKVGLNRIKYESNWPHYNQQEKIEYVKCLLAPFVVSESLISLFIIEADKASSK